MSPLELAVQEVVGGRNISMEAYEYNCIAPVETKAVEMPVVASWVISQHQVVVGKKRLCHCGNGEPVMQQNNPHSECRKCTWEKGC